MCSSDLFLKFDDLAVNPVSHLLLRLLAANHGLFVLDILPQLEAVLLFGLNLSLLGGGNVLLSMVSIPGECGCADIVNFDWCYLPKWVN